MKLVLGTVQLGLDYGIVNKNGKPTSEKALEILNTAIDNNIYIFDTAQDYTSFRFVVRGFGNRGLFHFRKIHSRCPKVAPSTARAMRSQTHHGHPLKNFRKPLQRHGNLGLFLLPVQYG